MLVALSVGIDEAHDFLCVFVLSGLSLAFDSSCLFIKKNVSDMNHMWVTTTSWSFSIRCVF